jgi:hypothetical protein
MAYFFPGLAWGTNTRFRLSALVVITLGISSGRGLFSNSFQQDFHTG